MDIRKANAEDFDKINAIFENAREYMRLNGNAEQWKNGYPYPDVITDDINAGICYVCADGDNINGVFTLFDGPEPCYANIYNGNWINEKPYGVIHRIAVNNNRKGVASVCIAYCESKYENLRIDTHRDNIPMRSFLKKHGFLQCGTVIIENGEERIAFQKTTGAD